MTSFDKAATDVDDLDVLYDFARESLGDDADVAASSPESQELDETYSRAVKEVEDLELKNMLGAEGDNLGAILTINSGAGGTESNDWSSMLMRMYMRWGERNGYKVTVTDMQEGDEAGIKSATIEFDGEYAYGYLKAENGVHRLVRISPFNAQGKRQTTFSSVFVYPLVDDSIEVVVDPSKLSEILIENTETRDQPKNREKAMLLLKSRLYDLEMKRRQAKKDEIEGQKMKIEWGSQIRSYVLHPYKMVSDLRTGLKTADTQGVLDGDLNQFMKAYLMQQGNGAKSG